MMRKRPLPLLLLALTCLFSPSCSKKSVAPVAPQVGLNAAQIDTIMTRVAGLRGMPFKRTPRIGYTTAAAYAASVGVSVEQQFGDFEDTGLTSELYQLGLLSSQDSSVKRIMTEFESGFPAAYYTIGTDSLTIITEAASDDTSLTIYLAHELTHALDDQYGFLSIQPFPINSLYGSDRYLARTSLIEGDADALTALYAYSYLYLRPDPLQSARNYALSLRTSFLTYQDGFSGQPYFTAPGYAPYDLGPHYVLSKVAAGWSGVNACYTVNTMPVSTAEIIRLQRSEPRSIDLSGVQTLLLSNLPGVAFIDDDNLGPVVIMAAVKQHDSTLAIRSPGNADSAFGWTGDRMTYLHRTGQRSGTLVWALTFGTNSRAGVFYDYLKGNFVQRRSTQAATVFIASGAEVSGPNGYRRMDYAAGSVASRVAMQGSAVWWIDNAGSLTASIDSLLRTQLAAGSAKNAVSLQCAGAFDNGIKAKALQAVIGKGSPPRHRRI